MTWVRLDYSLREDPRIADLADILDIQIRESFGIVTALYSWAVEHAPTGDVSSIRPRALARATWWDESSAADLIAALADAGIVRDGAIVGWREIGGLVSEKRERDAERKRASRSSCPRDVRVTSAGHPMDVTQDVRVTSAPTNVTDMTNGTDGTDVDVDAHVHAHAPTPAREAPAENRCAEDATTSAPITQETPERAPETPQPLPLPSAQDPQESPPRSAPPPPHPGPPPGHLRQQPRGPAWDPKACSDTDLDRLREASLRRLLDPAAWLVSVASYLRDKGEPPALQRWESLTHDERIAEAVAALEITGQRVRSAWDAYAKKLLLDAMSGGRSLAQERAAPARASPAQEAENLTPGQRMRRYAEKIGHPAAFAAPPPAPGATPSAPIITEGPIIDIEAG